MSQAAVNAIEDYVLDHRKAAEAWPQIVIAGAPDPRVPRQKPEAVGEGVDEAVGGFDAALASHIEPYAVEVGLRLRQKNEAH